MLLLKIFSIFLLITLTVGQHGNNQRRQEIIPERVSSRFGVKYDEALEAIFSVAIRLETLLSDTGVKTGKNFMVSPLSMAVAIGELLLGARGNLQKQLYDLLVIDSANDTRSESVRHLKVDDNQYLQYHALHEQLGDLMQTLQKRGHVAKSYTLKTASVLFYQPNLTIKHSYKHHVSKFYGTEIKEVDFARDPIGSERIVNQWASDNTNGLIKNILPGPLSPGTAAILANAVYFRGEWQIPFSSEINRNGVFRTSPYNSINVTYMMGEFENYKYVDSKQMNCKMVIIPYQNSELAMYIVMPYEDNDKEYNINEFTSNLRTKDILELIGSAKQRKVFMMLPKMQLSNTLNVLGPLKRYHNYKERADLQSRLNLIGDQFDRLDEKIVQFKNISVTQRFERDNLDLSGISDDPRFQLSDIYQQMTLSVNEKGTEAVAVAASAIDYILDSVSFNVNRPFLFFIRHEETEATLFWGTIVDPTEEM